MSQRRPEAKPEPLLRPRDYLRLMSLMVAAAFILWAMVKASDPRTWEWIAVFQKKPPEAKIDAEPQAEPDRRASPVALEMQSAASRSAGLLGLALSFPLTPGSAEGGAMTVLADEFVPLSETPEEQRLPTNPSAPTPEWRWVSGAIDHEVFLEEDETSQELDPKRRDADARYHLISLAKEATLEQLAADAQRNVRFSALMTKPREYRGRIIRIHGDLIWVQTFELVRPTPGLEFIYQGLIVDPKTGYSYGILFTDLPPHLPPQRLWNRLYLRDVTFDGYFLKVLKVQLPPDRNNPARTGYVPVLVGKSPIIPEPPPRFDLLATLRTIGLTAVILFVLAATALYLYRRSERRYQEKMAEIRARRQAVQAEAGSQPPGDVNFEAFVEDSRRATPPEPSEN
ncbi:MAG: hypothetical protein NZM31_03770 [Gemmatales bacterium]|nr:hypothetical protein [Gemmatales bacterium]MDW8386118.1 hypothetical protein [Gemmatales bacterium]